MKLLAILLRTSWRMTALSAFIGGVSGIVSVAVMAAILHAAADPYRSAAGTILLFAAFCLITLATQFISQAIVSRLTQHSMLELQMGLCRRLLAAPVKQIEEIGSPRLLATLSDDVFTVAQAMTAIPALVVSVATLLCGAVYVGWLSPSLLLATFVFGLFGVASYQFSDLWSSRYLVKARDERDILQMRIQQLIEGVKELKIHEPRRREFVEEALLSAETTARHSQFVGDCLQEAAVTWGRTVVFIAIGLLLFAWPRFQQVDAVTLNGYVLTFLYLISPLDRIISWMPYMKRAAVSIDKIDRLGLILENSQHEEGADVETWNQIELSGVTHTYRANGRPQGFVLGPADLTLTPGETVFLTGGNGSGKTSLAKLIVGLYQPEQGTVCLNGEPVTDDNRDSYRQLFSVVFDDGMIFDALWGLDAADLDRRAAEYIAELELDHVVSITNGKFSTTALSRGQRKRLALLTAYLEDRPIYLFDEWAADQDPEFRRLFYLKLLPELKGKGKTVIAITHDDRYFDCADRIVKLEEGRLAERTLSEDTHEAQLELL